MRMFLLSVLISLSMSQQLVPIPSPPDGFFLSPVVKPYNVTLEVYFDHLCSDSKAAYPGLIAYYGKNSDWLQLVIHIFPLPYHHYSFFVAKAGRYIQENMPEKFLDFMVYMFAHQDVFLVDALKWDIPTILNKVAQYTSFCTGAGRSQVLAGLKNPDIDESSRVSWKYAADREITGTPQYLVNGVLVAELSTYTKEESWETFFRNLKPNQ